LKLTNQQDSLPNLHQFSSSECREREEEEEEEEEI